MSGNPSPPSPPPAPGLTKHSVDPTDSQEITSFKLLVLRIEYEISREQSDQQKYAKTIHLTSLLCSAAYGQGLDPDDEVLGKVKEIEEELEQLRSPYPFPPTIIPYEDGASYTIKSELVLEVSRVLAHQMPAMYEPISRGLREHAFNKEVTRAERLKRQIRTIYFQRQWLKFDEVLSTKASARERGVSWNPLPPVAEEAGSKAARPTMPAPEMSGPE